MRSRFGRWDIEDGENGDTETLGHGDAEIAPSKEALTDDEYKKLQRIARISGGY